MQKKICALALLAALLLGCFAAAEQAPGYEVVFSSANPIPDIADRVRPAIVAVVSKAQNWDAVTRVSSEEVLGSGSGSYFRAASDGPGGYILTNNHVVEEGEIFTIEWLSGEIMPATLVGRDDGTDMAVLRFEDAVPAGVEPIALGDSDALRIGELAICIGNPGTAEKLLSGTVTAGIISGLERDGINAGNFSRNPGLIQTDAAINFGNSGGALLNSAGELVGVPTLGYNSAVFEGLGFCVPINTVKPLIEQIIDTGSVTRPRLGITVSDIDGPEEPMRKYPPIGAQVFTVEENSPSAKAGIQVGDVITEINGVRIRSYMELLSELDKCQAGDKVTLKIYRYYDASGELTGDYQELTLTVKLEMLD